MKARMIQTRFWEDNYILELNPTQKLLFMFLISNPKIERTGAYEMPISIISMWTSLSKNDVEKYLDQFTKDKKIIYIDNYVIVVNHFKYQDFTGGNEWQRKAFKRELSLLPNNIRDIVNQLITSYTTSSTTSPELVIQLDTNTNTKSITKPKTKPKRKKQTKKKISKELFKTYTENLMLDYDQTSESLKYFISKKPEIIQEFEEKYKFRKVDLCWERLVYYCYDKNKEYKDYKAAMNNWLRRNKDDQFTRRLSKLNRKEDITKKNKKQRDDIEKLKSQTGNKFKF